LPLVDTSSIIGGYSQIISDWANGDDRQFSGDVLASLPVGDQDLTDAYFTLKRSPNDTDAQAVVQKHVTQSIGMAGQITIGVGGHASKILIKVFSGDYEGLTQPGVVYSWDFRVITTSGVTYTVAIGVVSQLPNVTATNKAGTPAVTTNNGQPQFRGFITQNPQALAIPMISNIGDWYRNANPVSGAPSGWVCIGQGSPGVWRTDGIVGDT
jgi:hypothetical protein